MIVAREIDQPQIGRGGKPAANETFPKDRRCEVCRAILSIYNPTKRCWLHGRWGSEVTDA